MKIKRILQFENKKFWRSKKNTAIFAVFLLSLMFMVMFNTGQDKAYWDTQVQKLDVEIVRIKLLIKEIEAEIDHAEDSIPNDVDELARLNEYLNFANAQRLFNLRQRVHAQVNNQDRSERLELWIERDQNLLTGLEKGFDFLDEEPALVQQRLSVNQHLFQENIEPANSPYEMTAVNFLYHLTSYPWILFVLIALAMLNIDIFSGDIDGGAYKFLYSQPYKRSKILAGKHLVYAGNSFAMITALIVIAFVVIALVNGLGVPNYPTFYNTASYYSLTVPTFALASESTLSFLPWSSYIVRTLPLYVVLCWFFISLTGTASLLLRNTANVFSNVICLLFLDFSIRTLFPVDSSIRVLWPMTAAGLNNVLQGLYSLSASAYLILLGVLTFTLLIGSLLFLKKRDLTGGVD